MHRRVVLRSRRVPPHDDEPRRRTPAAASRESARGEPPYDQILKDTR
jgi:hypothetical protein